MQVSAVPAAPHRALLVPLGLGLESQASPGCWEMPAVFCPIQPQSAAGPDGIQGMPALLAL